MKLTILNKLININKQCIIIEKILNKTKIINHPKLQQLLTKYKKLKKINNLYNLWKINQELVEIANFLHKDQSSNINHNHIVEQSTIDTYKLEQKNLEYQIYNILLPSDPYDKNNCIIEIHAATGGIEASLFAHDLFKMYLKYCELNNLKTNIINVHYNELGGYKEIIFNICGPFAYKKFKLESGGHRVQRIPITENQGRIHTSSCSIAVMPILPEVNLPILLSKDLKIDTFKSSGAGGQHVNTTDSAIRITHLPTGIVVECQDERSQHKNKAKALLILKNRILHIQQQTLKNEIAVTKKNLLGSGNRSCRIRTYNYPKGRITDHRINLTLFNLTSIMNGQLNLLFMPLYKAYYEQLINNC